MIKQIHIPIRKRVDSWYWLFDDTSRFTVKRCYRKIKGDNEFPDRRFWNKVWGVKLPGNVINFVWRKCRDVTPTTANLITEHVYIVDRCAWFQNHAEDICNIPHQLDKRVFGPL